MVDKEFKGLSDDDRQALDAAAMQCGWDLDEFDKDYIEKRWASAEMVAGYVQEGIDAGGDAAMVRRFLFSFAMDSAIHAKRTDAIRLDLANEGTES